MDHIWWSCSVCTCRFDSDAENPGYVWIQVTRQGSGYQDFKKEWKDLERETGMQWQTITINKGSQLGEMTDLLILYRHGGK